MDISKVKPDLTDILVCENPLAIHNLTILRDKNTTAQVFKIAIKRLSSLVLVDAVKNLPLTTVNVSTPLEDTQSKIIDESYTIIIAPILRAALTMSEILEELLPAATVYHIGLYRDKNTLKPVHYYNKIPKSLDNPSKTIVYLLDPMFATGGSAIEAVNIFKDLDIKEENITFVSLLAAPEGINNFRNHHKNVRLVTASIDKRLNDKGYIMPGLGDAGDRTYNT